MFLSRNTIGAALLLVAAVCTTGCASLRQRGAVPEGVATCRELCCQGVASIEAGNWEQAETLLRDAVTVSPADTVARRHLAEVLWQRGAADNALLQMEAAVQLDPTDAALAVRSGEMMLATGETGRALERAEQAIGLDSRLASAWALRGRVHWQQGHTDRALADLQRAVQFAPAATDLLIDLATLYRQRGQHQRCLTTVHHMLDNYPPGNEPQLVLCLQGLALADLGRWSEARPCLAAASQRGTPSAELLYYLARAELFAGDRQAAAAAAQRALSADASHDASRQFLAKLASGKGGQRLVR